VEGHLERRSQWAIFGQGSLHFTAAGSTRGAGADHHGREAFDRVSRGPSAGLVEGGRDARGGNEGDNSIT